MHVAREMERQGFKLPLLDRRRHHQPRAHGGQDRAALQRAGRARARREPRRAGDDQPAQRRGQGRLRRAAPRRVRAICASIHGAPQAEARPARRRRAPTARRSTWRAEDVPTPEFTGVRVLDDFPLATLREYIDWTPFFHTWELKGVYPRILEHEKYGEQARADLRRGATRCSTRSSPRSCSRARGVYGLFPANAVGDDVELYTDDGAPHVLDALPLPAPAGERRETGRAAAARWPTSSRRKSTGPAPITSAASRSPPASACKELCDAVPAPKHDDYNAIMAEALADRLAEAFAECLHKRVRDEWGYGRTRSSRNERAHPREVPRHPPRGRLSRLPRSHREGDALAAARRREERPACSSPSRSRCGPGSSVSGLYFAHPEARYFTARQDRPRPGRRLRTRARG